MNTPWKLLSCVLTLALAGAVPLRAQDKKTVDSSEKCAGGGDGAKCGDTLTFPFKEEIGKKQAKSELKCEGGKKAADGKIAYAKCKHKSFEGFDEVAVKLKLVASKEKFQALDKDKARRAKELSALHSANKALSERMKAIKAKDQDTAAKAEEKQLAGAAEKVKADTAKAVSKCKEKDSADMACEAAFPEEKE